MSVGCDTNTCLDVSVVSCVACRCSMCLTVSVIVIVSTRVSSVMMVVAMHGRFRMHVHSINEVCIGLLSLRSVLASVSNH